MFNTFGRLWCRCKVFFLSGLRFVLEKLGCFLFSYGPSNGGVRPHALISLMTKTTALVAARYPALPTSMASTMVPEAEGRAAWRHHKRHPSSYSHLVR